MNRLLDNVYEICKLIKSFPISKDIRKVLNNVHHKKGDYSTLGDLGRRFGLQFLGYLYFSKSEKINKDFKLILKPKLSEEEVSLLGYGHKYILEINKLCFEIIERILPNSTASINPYAHYEYTLAHQKNSFNLNNELIKNFISNFEKLPTILDIIDCISREPKLINVSRDDLFNSVNKIGKQIYKFGTFDESPEFQDLDSRLRKKFPQDIFFVLILSLASLKTSIKVLDQLLYQAFLCDKLISFDEENVYQINKHVHNSIGESLSVAIQLNGPEILLDPSDLVFINIPYKGVKGLAIIEAMKIIPSHDFGDTISFSMRMVDGNLSYYHNLLSGYQC